MDIKTRLIKKLVQVYGDDFKSPLARDLSVNVSTIRRIFNQREAIPLVYQKAIIQLICGKSGRCIEIDDLPAKTDKAELINSVRCDKTIDIFGGEK